MSAMKKRIKALEFHIEMGDYFGTLATLLDLLRQGIVSKDDEGQILKDLIGDLLHLQKYFKISEKDK
jgi:hypothetical protein